MTNIIIFLFFPLLSSFFFFLPFFYFLSFLLFLPSFLSFFSVFETGSYNTAQMVLNSLFSFLLPRDYWCGPPHPALSSIFSRSQAAASGATEKKKKKKKSNPLGFTADTRRKKANSSSLWLPKGKTTSEGQGSPSCLFTEPVGRHNRFRGLNPCAREAGNIHSQ